MKQAILLVVGIMSSTAFAGIPLPSFNIPTNQLPEDEQTLENPVTLEATTEAIPQDAIDLGATWEGKEWYVGEWEAYGDYQAEFALPFTFTLDDKDYDYFKVSSIGSVLLLPTNYDAEHTSMGRWLRADAWTGIDNGGSFIQGNFHPTLFALAKNNVGNQYYDCDFQVSSESGNDRVEGFYLNRTASAVTVLFQNNIDCNPSAADTTGFSHTVNSVIVIKSNNDVEFMFDTDFPFASLTTDSSDDLGVSSGPYERFYSGIVIPQSARTDAIALPLVNHISTDGAKRFVYTSGTLEAIAEVDLPGNGTPVADAAPVSADVTTDLSALAGSIQILESTDYFVELDATLADGLYYWSVRDIYNIPGFGTRESDWSATTQFTIETPEPETETETEVEGDSDKKRNRLFGSLGLWLAPLLSVLLLLARKTK